MIEFASVYKKYGKIIAIDGITFSVSQGETLALLGPNGAGKTSLLRMMTGFHLPDSGDVLLGGESVGQNPLAVKKRIGYVPEIVSLYQDQRVYEFLRFCARIRGVSAKQEKMAVERVIAQCGLQKYEKQLIRNLSKGYRQRVGLAQATVHNPEILILDEPTSGLDPNQIIDIRNLIHDFGKEKTVLISSHSLHEIELLSSRMIIINHGKLVAEGSKQEIASIIQQDRAFQFEVLHEDVQKISNHVEQIKGYVKHESHNIQSGQCVCKVYVQADISNQEASGNIFDWAVEHSIRLIKLMPLETDLEQVFAAVTGKAGKENE